jgi:MFS family permease
MKERIQTTLKDNVAMRWVVLILVSALMFATYWFQDFYSGIKDLVETDLGFTSEQYGRMIGLTTIANMFGMIIVGGIILDKWGIKLAGIVFGGLAAIGGFVSYLGASGAFGEENAFIGMVAGRILFGVGLEVTCVVSTRTVVKWFKGHELALALAINMGFGRLGSALGIALSFDIAGGSVSPAVAFAATIIGLALIMFLIYTVFDMKLDKQVKQIAKDNDEVEAPEEDFKFDDLVKLATNKSFIYIALLCVAFYSAVFPFITYAPDLLVNKFGFSYQLPETGGHIFLFGSSMIGNTSVYIVFFIFGLSFSMIPSKMKSMGGKLLSLLVIIAAFAAYISFYSDVLSIWLQNGPKTASLIPLGTILFTPIFGNFVDKKGKAASVMILGALLLIFAHLSLSIFDSATLAYFGLLSLGIAFSLVPAAMWPSVAKIVAENRLGTAYASMFTIQNWGLGLFFWGIGALLDFVNKDNLAAIRAGDMMYDYTIPILVLVGSGVISIFLAFQLKKADKKQGFGLEEPNIKD